MADVLVTGIKIGDMPLKGTVSGDEKLPTGDVGDLAVTPNQIKNFTIQEGNLVNQEQLDDAIESVGQTTSGLAGRVQTLEDRTSNINNTADLDKPISNATQAALDLKANKADVYDKTQVYNKTETYSKTEVNNLLSSKVSSVNGKTGEVVLAPKDIASVGSNFLTVNPSFDGIPEILDKGGIKDPVANAQVQALLNRSEYLINRRLGKVATIADLQAIPNPFDGQIMLVVSYYDGYAVENPYSGPVGGGIFIYNSAKSTVNNGGTVINGWVRVVEDFVSIDDFGAHPSKDFTTNSNAINAALANWSKVYFPHGKIYQIDFDIINVNSNQHIFGGAVLQGQQTQTTGADGRGVFLKIQGKQNVTVEGITIRNGYRGRGIECTNSQFVRFKGVTLDGFTYCMWVGEQRLSDTEVRGCQYVWIENCSFLSARYWNLYIRGASITDDAVKTQNIWVINPYVYNASMAGIVLAEGHVKNVVIENPFFKRCNLNMHFELATDVTVINPRDEDTGKKPDHQPPNTEYPYVGWSIYTAFAHRIKIKGGQMTTTCYHFGTAEQPSSFIEYEGFTGFDFVYEAGSTPDSAKNIFQNYTFNNVTATSRLAWQNNNAGHYLRDFTYRGCRVVGGTSRMAMNTPRTVNLKVLDCYMVNSYVVIGNEGYSQFIGNTVTNNVASVSTFNGADLTSIFDFKDNTFINTATNLGDRVFTIQNFGVVNFDNTLNANAQYSAVIDNVTQLTWGLSPHLQLRSNTPYSATNVTSIVSARRPLELVSYTSANLSSATHAVNTTGKYFGKEVYNTTTSKFMKSLGSIPTAGWVQSDDNSVVITPA